MKHLLGIADLSKDDITKILDLAETFAEINTRPIKKVPTLRGKTVINLFLEASTRTRTSFEIAAKRLSADAVNISGSTSSTTKGETLLDTAKNLQAMAPDVIVLRHASSGAPHFIAAHVDAAVINAGDGTHEHPTQALLDCATIRKHKGRAGGDLAGLTVAIVGDIAHSRVARSDILALSRLGARVRVAGPRTMLPVGIEDMGAEVFERVEPAVADADVVMMLRIQLERLGGAGLFPNTREYSRYFGLGPRLAATLKPDAIVMHPGPINRGVELDPAVADGERSVILDQVTYGVAVRMAILYLCGGGSSAPAEA
ncbi:MAG TPA: aspartate carbamoyltransferase catalytic subunit [Polyangia bacterium]|nr:aspartate carbamoyltransferase catalytic subunit [Polyangia bacterium]